MIEHVDAVETLTDKMDAPLSAPFSSHDNQAHLRAAIAELEAGGGTVHELIEDN